MGTTNPEQVKNIYIFAKKYTDVPAYSGTKTFLSVQRCLLHYLLRVDRKKLQDTKTNENYDVEFAFTK